MKKYALTALTVAISTVTVLQTPAFAELNIFTGSTVSSSNSGTSSSGNESTATSNTAAKNNTFGSNSSQADNRNLTVAPSQPTDVNEQKLANQALQQIKGSVVDAAKACATEEDGLGQAVAKTVAERQKEQLQMPTVSDMVKAAKENKNSLSVGCFTASTEVINLSTLVPDLQNGLGSAIGRVVQNQINNMIQKTKDALMQQVCDVGNEMIAQAMKPINDQISKANANIAGLSLDSLVGSQIANSFGGNDKFSQIVKDSLSEVVSQTDAELTARRNDYANKIGYSASYDPFASIKASANQVYNNADTIAQTAVNNANTAVNSTMTGITTPSPTVQRTPQAVQTPNVQTAPIVTAPIQSSPSSMGDTNRFTGGTSTNNSNSTNPFTRN